MDTLMLVATIAALAWLARGFLAESEAFRAVAAPAPAVPAVHLAREAGPLLRVRP